MLKINASVTDERFYSSSHLSNLIASNPLRRSLNTAGRPDFNLRCGHCDTQEPENKKFFKCERCMKMRYCSRECQVTLIVRIVDVHEYFVGSSMDVT